MPIDETRQRSFGLEEPRTSAILDGQVKEQMAVDDVGVGFALSAPYARQSTRDSPPKEPFVESFTDSGEEPAIGIVKDHCARPVNRRVGNQGKADCFCVIDRLDDVGGLSQGEALAAMRSVAAWLLSVVCCTGAHNR